MIIIAEQLAKREQQRGFAASDRSSDADGECPRSIVARERLATLFKDSGASGVIVSVGVLEIVWEIVHR
jgi:hypothetical protein